MDWPRKIYNVNSPNHPGCKLRVRQHASRPSGRSFVRADRCPVQLAPNHLCFQRSLRERVPIVRQSSCRTGHVLGETRREGRLNCRRNQLRLARRCRSHQRHAMVPEHQHMATVQGVHEVVVDSRSTCLCGPTAPITRSRPSDSDSRKRPIGNSGAFFCSPRSF